METEIWKPIPGYEGLYEVSNFGNIKSVDRIYEDSFGRIVFRKGKELKKRILLNTYYSVILYKKNKKKKIYIHRIMYSSFYGFDVNSKLVINHLDGNKLNNKLINLELVNHRENMTHSINFNNKTSNYIGVYSSLNKKGILRWKSCFSFNNKTIHVGTFKTEKEAHEAYLQALKEHGLQNKYATENQE